MVCSCPAPNSRAQLNRPVHEKPRSRWFADHECLAFFLPCKCAFASLMQLYTMCRLQEVHIKYLRSVLYVNLVLLLVPVNSTLVRMLMCTPSLSTVFRTESAPQTAAFGSAYLSRSAFWQDGDFLEALLTPPEPKAIFGASGIPALFGGEGQCYSGYHLAHAIIALLLFGSNCWIMSLTALAKRYQPLGSALHLDPLSIRTQHPGTHVYALADFVYECCTPLASVFTFSVIADFLPRGILGLYATFSAATIVVFFAVGASSREALYETVVFACLISLTSVFFCAWYVSFGSLQSVDLGTTVAVMMVAGLFAGTAASFGRNARIHVSNLSSQRWSAHVLQWINLKTREATARFMQLQARTHVRSRPLVGGGAKKYSQLVQQQAAWLDAWNHSSIKHDSDSIAACREHIRPVTAACRGALRQLLSRYPYSATAHLIAAEYLSSPVVSNDRLEQLRHVSAALRYSGGMIWHRVQCMQHLKACRHMHAGLLLQSLQSRQSQFGKELGMMGSCAERVHAVRANVVQLSNAAQGADVALLASVRESIESVHTACRRVMAALDKHRGDKVVFERLVRQFVLLVSAPSLHQGQQRGEQAAVSSEAMILDGSPFKGTRVNLMLGISGTHSSDAHRGKKLLGTGVRQSTMNADWQGSKLAQRPPSFMQMSALEAPSRRGFIPIFGSTVLRDMDDPKQTRNTSYAATPSNVPTDPRIISCNSVGSHRQRSSSVWSQRDQSPPYGAASASAEIGHELAQQIVSGNWLLCGTRSISLGEHGQMSPNTRLPQLVQQLLHSSSLRKDSFALGDAGDAGDDERAAEQSGLASTSRVAAYHCILQYSPEAASWVFRYATHALHDLLGTNSHTLSRTGLLDVFSAPGSATSSDFIQGAIAGQTVKIGHDADSGLPPAAASLFANVLALPTWSGGAGGAQDLQAPATCRCISQVSSCLLLLVEPVVTIAAGRSGRRFSAPPSPVAASPSTPGRASNDGSPSRVDVFPSTPSSQIRAGLSRKDSAGSAISVGSSKLALLSPIAGASDLASALVGLRRREVERNQTRVRHQLQRAVKHDKYSFRYLLGVMSCIAAVTLYSLYSAYIVLGAGNNPLITLRFRQPAAASQMLPAGQRAKVWGNALQVLNLAASSAPPSSAAPADAQRALQLAAAATEVHLREMTEALAERVNLALSDASLLDVTAGVTSVTDSWREAPLDNSSAALPSLALTERLLAASFRINDAAANGGVMAQQGVELFDIASNVNATAQVGVEILNTEFNAILQLRTALAILLTVTFVTFTLSYTCSVEKKLLGRATAALSWEVGAQYGRDASRPRSETHSAKGRFADTNQKQSVALEQMQPHSSLQQMSLEADLSLQAANRRISQHRSCSLGSYCSTFLLRHLLFVQLLLALTMGVGLIGVGFIQRYLPEDTQATSVNAVYAAHQMQYAAWTATAALDGMLAAGSHSMPLQPAAAQLQAAMDSYTHWQRVLFSSEHAGFMVSASPGHTGAARYPDASAGERLLFVDACQGSIEVVPQGAEIKYLSSYQPESLGARSHATKCSTVMEGVLLDGWQVASHAFSNNLQSLKATLQDIHMRALVNTTATNTTSKSLACFRALRTAVWGGVGAQLSATATESAPKTGISELMHWAGSVCAEAHPSLQHDSDAWLARAVQVIGLQAVHFDELAQATAVHGIRGFLASLAKFGTDSMLPVACVPLVLFLFLWLVGAPSALSKRRTVQAAELMSALLNVHRSREQC